MTRAQEKTRAKAEKSASLWTPEILTRLAVLIALVVVIARLTYSDNARFRDEAYAAGAPRGSTAAGAIGMDLLACVPALLVLARRVSDKQYVLRWSWAVLPMLLLALWGGVSIFWSADKFGALLASSHWAAASVLMWAGVQLVRSWGRLRLVASVSAGLLLALFAHALLYRTMDVAELKSYWTTYSCPDHADVKQTSPGTCPKDGKPLVTGRQTYMTSHGLSEGDFQLQQFDRKLMAGEAMGFSSSPNTFAAITVLLMLIVFGLAIQQVIDDRQNPAGWALLVLIPLGAWILFQARSTTSIATPVLGAILIIVAWRYRAFFQAKAKKLYWAGVIGVVIATAAVVGHGLKHHSLFHTSLTFRWNYWSGAMRIFAGHPLAGVGMDNFSQYYLAHRLPEAAEQVKDPHNFLVKFLVDLGIIGAILCIAWLGRMWWELGGIGCQPMSPSGAPPAQAEPGRGGASKSAGTKSGIGTIALICALAMLLNVLASLDFTGGGADGAWSVTLDLLRKTILLGALIIGTTVAAVRSLSSQELDDRPAPIVLYAILAAMGMFLVHNLIDFSLFEAGPMMLFALLAGCALGVRQPSIAGKKKRTIAAAVSLGVGLVLWLVAAGFIWIPTVIAEDAAGDALYALRGVKPPRPNESARLFTKAYENQPLEADYLFRAARALATKDVYDTQVPGLLANAIKANPRESKYYLMRAWYLLRGPDAALSRPQIESDYRKAIELDPNEIDIRLGFGDALAGFNTPEDRREAIEQYQAAIRLNDQLKPDEPTRRRGAALATINDRIERLQKAGSGK